jgi:hypothetical protein
MHTEFAGNREGKRPLGSHGVDGRITLKQILRKQDFRGLDTSGSGYGHVNMVKNIRFPYKAGNFLTS